MFDVFCSAEHDIFGEVSSSDDEVNILDSGDEAAGPAGFRPDDVKDSLDLGFAEAAAVLDPDVCESLKRCSRNFENAAIMKVQMYHLNFVFWACYDFHYGTITIFDVLVLVRRI